MHEGVESETYFQWLSQAAPHVQLHHLMSGYWISAAIHVAAEINLADLLAAGQQTSAALAQQTQTHPQAMSRLLRTLASVGLFTEVEPGAFELTALGVLLKTDHPMSMRALTRYTCSRMQWQRFGALRRAVETGGSVDLEVLGMSGHECDFNHILAELLRHNLAVPLRPALLSAMLPAGAFIDNLAASPPARA